MKAPPLLKDSLYRGTLFIFLSNITSSGLGFIFWLVASKYYPKAEIGFAVAVLSALSLVILISRVGLDQSIIRFFPDRDKGSIMTSALLVTTIIAVLLDVIIIVFADFWSSDFHLIKNNPLVFSTLVLTTSVLSIFGSAFLASRKAEYFLVQNVMTGLRIPLLVPLVAFGALGILLSTGAATVLVLLVMVPFVFRTGVRFKRFDSRFVKDTFRFSLANYFSVLFSSAPALIMPIVVLNVLGPEISAVYYITYSFAAIIFMIPSAMSISLFVEGSHGESLLRMVSKSFISSMLVLVPVVIGVFVAGGWALSLVGPDYAAQGAELLSTMALSSFFVLVFQIFISVKTVQKQYASLLLFSGLQFALLVLLGYIFVTTMGLPGIGYAWLVNSIIICGLVVVVERRNVSRVFASFMRRRHEVSV